LQVLLLNLLTSWALNCLTNLNKFLTKNSPDKEKMAGAYSDGTDICLCLFILVDGDDAADKESTEDDIAALMRKYGDETSNAGKLSGDK
jgi:hypothetical protein